MPSNATTNGKLVGCDFGLHRDSWGQLVLTDGAGRQASVEPVRAFPLSDPGCGIALCDAEGRERLWIERLGDIPAAARALLEEELTRREFAPVLLRVISVSASTEPSVWEVDTDRGRTRFLLNSEEDVHHLDNGAALMRDANGVRYLIPDLRRLDSASRRRLERYL